MQANKNDFLICLVYFPEKADMAAFECECQGQMYTCI